MKELPEWKKPEISELKKGENPELHRYGAARFLGDQFKERILREDRQAESKNYHGWNGGLLFLRYYSLHRRKYEGNASRYGARVNENQSTDSKTRKMPIGMWSVRQELRYPDGPDVMFPEMPYKDIIRIRREIVKVDDSYNTEDGQIRWLIDHNFGQVSLLDFLHLVPPSVRSRMKNWRSMSDMRADKAGKIFSALTDANQAELLEKYNTLDGRARWLRDNGFAGTNLALFRQITPQRINKLMTRWEVHAETMTFARAERYHPAMEITAKMLREEFGVDDLFLERRIASVISDFTSSDNRIRDILHTAYEHADKLLVELSLARLIMPEQKDFDIKTMHQLYNFAKTRFSLEPEVIWVIMRLKGLSVRGVRGLIRRGERAVSQDIPLDSPAYRDDPMGESLGAKTGEEDLAFERAEARMVLEEIAKAGHLHSAQITVLERVISGNDIEDSEYEELASAIKLHPELLELLGLSEEE